jgi:hypothetical protein
VQNILRHISALIRALRFDGADPQGLKALGRSDWNKLLFFSDRMHLALPLFRIHGSDLPDWVQARLAQNLVDNTERFEHIQFIYTEIAQRLCDLALDHLVLKGFAQCPAFIEEPRYRMQSDLDLFSPADNIFRVRDALSALGYEPMLGLHPPGAEHLPPMMRNTKWVWNGNSYDPKMPLAVELHFSFWNDVTTGLHPSRLDQFWVRRNQHQVANFSFPSLGKVDSLAYSALHVFHHLQIGGLVASHVYELAYFLHHNAKDSNFWKQWHELHDPSLRKIQAVCFRLASEWFACRLSEEVQKEIDLLPPGVEPWFDQFANSPLNSLVRPNKDPLWLHLSLVNSWENRLSVLRHSLFPTRTLRLGSAQSGSARSLIRFVVHLFSRLTYHLRILVPTLWHGIRWWWSTKRLGRGGEAFLAAFLCCSFAMFIG